MNKTIFMMIVLFFIFLHMDAAEKLIPRAVDDFEVRSAGFFTAENGIFTVTRSRISIHSKNSIAIDQAKSYRLTGEFRKRSGGHPSRFGFGIVFLNENGGILDPRYVSAVPDTETVLAEEVKPGSRKIKVADASKWERKKRVAAFLPEKGATLAENISPAVVHIEKIQPEGVWELTLSSPIRYKVGKGKYVRQHVASGQYIYAAYNHVPTDDWQKISLDITPDSLKGVNRLLWSLARGAKIIIHNSPAGSQADFEFRNLTLEEK